MKINKSKLEFAFHTFAEYSRQMTAKVCDNVCDNVCCGKKLHI